MLAPVVEKPDAASKSASTKENPVTPVNINGRAPNILSIIQLSETITKPSLAYIELSAGFL